MNRIVLGIFSAAVFSLALASCGGQLFIDEAALNPATPCTTWQDCEAGEVCIEMLCTEAEPCTLGNPDGVYCPEGRVCIDGVCKNPGGGGGNWCPPCPDGEGCDNGDCVTITPDNTCGPEHPDGVCSDGEVCVAGGDNTHCVPIISSCGCEDETQACEDGQCVDIPAEQACSPTNPGGKCADGKLCVAGVCQPWTNACSPNNPLGLCLPGTACVAGYCIPIDENPCGADNPGGLCSAGRLCTPPCTATPCSTAFPSGYCVGDEFCIAGNCEQLPCLPGHPGGACPEDWYCSFSGVCLEDGYCVHPDDCSSTGRQCSCEGQCIRNDDCMADCDCPDFNICNTTSAKCERTYDCVDDDGCPAATEFCGESDQCLPQGSCAENADCRANGVFCSEIGPCTDLHTTPATCLCLSVGDCRNDTDCLEVNPDGSYFCDADGECIEAGTCSVDEHCPPGHRCDVDTCVLGPNTCTANDFVNTCTGTDVLCCDSGTCCETEGEGCSTWNTCIQVGECLDDEDCLGSADGGYFTCVDYACTPVTAGCGACETDEKCSTATSSCIPEENCAGNKDCAEGEFCHATYTCVPALACGSPDPGGSLLKPNVMLVLDRSGSMQWCDLSGSSDSRWNEALGAIDTLTGSFNGTVSFGLTSYPLQWCGTDAACDACNPFTCDAIYCVGADNSCEADSSAAGAVCTSNTVPGKIDLAAQEFAYESINASLSSTFPGGGTPIGPTLRMLRTNATAAGIQVADRDNVVVLVTDGEANGDFADVAGCVGAPGVCVDSNGCPAGQTCYSAGEGGDGSCHDIPCKINQAIDDLNALPVSVDTFVIGFAFGAVSPNLNCYAIHGGRSLCNTDDPVCDLFETGGQAACEAASCTWSGSACGGNEDFCSTFTADGETDCEAALSCNWNSTGLDPVCEPDTTFCTDVAAGGSSSCTTAGCHWDGTCRGECSIHDGNQSACEDALCHYDTGRCVSVSTSNCRDVNATCYYDAGDATSLRQALDDIVGDVASCTFDLSSNPPPEIDKLYVYLEYLDPASVPEDCSNPTYEFCRHPRDRGHTQHWDYNPIEQQVEFFGDACDDLTTGVATPLVIYGCEVVGG